MINITYLFHSGFAVETERCILVFDYWMDPAHVMPHLVEKGKHVYVLVSHFHEGTTVRVNRVRPKIIAVG